MDQVIRHHPVYLQHMCIHPLYRAVEGVQLSSLDGRISHKVSLQWERETLEKHLSTMGRISVVPLKR